MFQDKKVLIAGAAGLIGRQLVDLLLDEGAQVHVCDIKNPEESFLKKVNYKKLDLTEYLNCIRVCEDMDYVFNLLCVKASPAIMLTRPADYFVPMILFNTNLMRAAKECNVPKYLYSSTLGVYAPAEVFHEDDVWTTFPSNNDRFAGWAKRMGELQAEAYKVQHGWDGVSIVRPANTYGPYDDFDSDAAMVVPSLIKKAFNSRGKLKVWGDGTTVRDFIHSRDIARGMLIVMKESPGPYKPVNLGSGTGYTIKQLADVIVKHCGKELKIEWDPSKVSGDKIRILDTNRAKEMGFEPLISLEDGIKDLIGWYRKNGTSKQD